MRVKMQEDFTSSYIAVIIHFGPISDFCLSFEPIAIWFFNVSLLRTMQCTC